VCVTDFGYDISDYESIQPEYGTMEDFDELIARAKELGKERERERDEKGRDTWSSCACIFTHTAITQV
jgi:hypothetical protein